MSWKTIATSLGVQYLGRIAGLGISLASMSLLTRHLGVTGFGEYTAALAIASLVLAFSDFGFFWSTIHTFMDRTDRLEAVRDILGIRTLTTLALIVLSVLFVQLGHFSPGVKQAYLLLSLFIFGNSVNNILVAVYQAEYRMVWPTLIELASRGVNLAFIGYGVATGRGLIWFIIGACASTLFNMGANWFGLLRKHPPIWPRLKGIAWRKYYDSVLLMGLMALFSALYYRVDMVVLSWMKDETDVGIYGAAYKIVELVIMAQGLFLASLFPLLVSKFKESETAFTAFVRQAIIILSALGAPLCIFGIFLAREVVGIIGGPTYVAASTISYHGTAITTPIALMILLSFTLVAYLTGTFTSAILATGAVSHLVKANILATVLNLGFNLWLIPRYSYLAAASVTLGTELLVMSINGAYFCRRFHFWPPWREVGTILFATLPGALFLYITQVYPFLPRAIFACLLYVGYLALFMPHIRRTVSELLSRKPRPV